MHGNLKNKTHALRLCSNLSESVRSAQLRRAHTSPLSASGVRVVLGRFESVQCWWAKGQMLVLHPYFSVPVDAVFMLKTRLP